MNLVITGGGGFLGRRLAQRVLERGGIDLGSRYQPVQRLTVLDLVEPALQQPAGLTFVQGTVNDAAAVSHAIPPDTDAIVHLAAVVSAEAENDLAKGLAVNLDGTRNVLAAAQACARPPRLVFASSVAAFGGDLPDIVGDGHPATPHSSYGTQKVIGELLVSDYSRRGIVDGRSLRIPTVAVRPGPPNRAASGFASGMVREPLAGVETVCPVRAGLRLWLTSPRTAVYNLWHGLALPATALGAGRTINLPGLSIRAGDMVAALRRVAGEHVAERVAFHRDPAVEAVVGSWPGAFSTSRAFALGFVGDTDFEGVIRQYIAETRAALPPATA